MKYQAVIFDFDDTLVKTREAKWRQHQAVAKRFYGIDLTEDTLRKHWGRPYDETLKAYYQNADTTENMRAAKVSLEAEFPIAAADGALEVVQKLSKKGIALGVLSSGRRELVLYDLKRLGFDMNAFCAVMGSDDTGVQKPHSAVFAPMLAALVRCGAAQDILCVGDSIRDYQAAQDADLDFVGITTGTTQKEEFNKAGITKVIHNLRSLLQHA